MVKKRFKIVAEVYLFLQKKDEVLLLKRQNTGYGDGQYSLIAGHVEDNETLTKSIIREAAEEAGIIVLEKDLRLLHIMYRQREKKSEDIRVGFFFTTNRYQGKIVNAEPQKCTEIAWFHLTRLPDNILPYIKTAIFEITNTTSIYSDYGF